jgi:hypothetical protein
MIATKIPKIRKNATLGAYAFSTFEVLSALRSFASLFAPASVDEGGRGVWTGAAVRRSAASR